MWALNQLKITITFFYIAISTWNIEKDHRVLTIPFIIWISSFLVEGFTLWYRNIVRSSGPSHCWVVLPITGGSAKAMILKEGWIGKIDLQKKKKMNIYNKCSGYVSGIVEMYSYTWMENITNRVVVHLVVV